METDLPTLKGLQSGLPLTPPKSVSLIFAGCDLGIVSAQAVLIRDEEIAALETIPYKNLPRQAANEVMEKALKKARLPSNKIDYCIATGHGKRAVPHADDFVHEMGCLQKGCSGHQPRDQDGY